MCLFLERNIPFQTDIFNNILHSFPFILHFLFLVIKTFLEWKVNIALPKANPFEKIVINKIK